MPKTGALVPLLSAPIWGADTLAELRTLTALPVGVTLHAASFTGVACMAVLSLLQAGALADVQHRA